MGDGAAAAAENFVATAAAREIGSTMESGAGKIAAEDPMNLFDLKNRVAVVTGGNGGIGLGMAMGLAGAGCAVSIWGRNAEKN